MKGYKVFNPNWTCRDMQYEVGKTYEMEEKPVICERGFHFCEKAADCFQYYRFDSDNKVAEIKAYGELDFENDRNKYCTNKIKIVRELHWHEVLDLVNIGKACTGCCNSGDCNSGDWNSGNRNSGNRNSGNWNSGNRNSGNCNSGDWNSGNCNSGNCNSGDGNSGDWNITSYSNGCFNTIVPTIHFFNKPSDWTYVTWMQSRAYHILSQGFFNNIHNKNPQEWWDNLQEEEQQEVLSLPNFDKDIFKNITGIDVEEEMGGGE